jgi:hypothetical protein
MLITFRIEFDPSVSALVERYIAVQERELKADQAKISSFASQMQALAKRLHDSGLPLNAAQAK